MLVVPLPPLVNNPYNGGTPLNETDASVCAVVYESAARDLYRLETFDSIDSAQGAGAFITHAHPCGVCSTLHDLASYMEIDMTGPVRKCGMLHPGHAADVACLISAVNFTEPCAEMWAFNTANTRQHCELICLLWINQPYNLPDGSLNPCLQCDEDMSGPIFKAYAGRTRRGSGLLSEIQRPASQIFRLEHDYF